MHKGNQAQGVLSKAGDARVVVMRAKNSNASGTKHDSPSTSMSSAQVEGIACCNCSSNSASPRRRTFSEQAWAALLVWEEVDVEAIDSPICDTCYHELREILIERSEDMDYITGQTKVLTKIRKRLSGFAS